eukprot:TRINITY_DN767_c1_g1_i2.p1 TRINITY_DN767_c1_g1~~TRINITY_DN767_c1_g1_i2.p1  ORF type:complete len:252 (-),score=42.66 TRINITY_DN767_c1_g1_i2:144-827(-)
MSSLWNKDGSTNTRTGKRASGGGTQHVNIFQESEKQQEVQHVRTTPTPRPGTAERVKQIHSDKIFIEDTQEENEVKAGVKLSDQRHKDMSGSDIFSDENEQKQYNGKLSDVKKKSLYNTQVFDGDEEQHSTAKLSDAKKKSLYETQVFEEDEAKSASGTGSKISEAKLKEVQGNDIFGATPTPSRTMNGRTPGGNSSICFGVAELDDDKNHIKAQQPPGGASQILFG